MTADELESLKANLTQWAQVGDDPARLTQWQQEARAALDAPGVLGTLLARHISRELSLIEEVRRLQDQRRAVTRERDRLKAWGADLEQAERDRAAALAGQQPPPAERNR